MMAPAMVTFTHVDGDTIIGAMREASAISPKPA
jgi:hypothetical protein